MKIATPGTGLGSLGPSGGGGGSGGGGAATLPLTTKGDLLGYGETAGRLPVGSNGYVLTAQSGQTLGLYWQTHELLMQDGVSAPPVPLENEARTDWIYEG